MTSDTTAEDDGLEAEVDEVVEDESQLDDETLIDVGDSALSYFGADFDVSGLVRRLVDEDIIVPRFDPDETQGATIKGFQRQRVWTAAKMEQFIESLLLGWPVPSIFLVLEPDQRYLVLDGQQRLSALRAFFDGAFPDGRPFALHEVAEHLQGATYDTLNRESKRKLNNTFIQATVIEPQEPDGRESVYRLFGRLNSGGVSLTAQEIRVALYRGACIDWIRDLNADVNWRVLFGNPHKRLKDHEMILRALAMQEAVAKINGKWTTKSATQAAYTPPMSAFLNDYLKRHREMEGLDREALTEAFQKTTKALVQAVGRDGIRINGRLNAAHVDAALGVLLTEAMKGHDLKQAALKAGINKLRRDKVYEGFITRSTSHRESVVGRLKLASEAFKS